MGWLRLMLKIKNFFKLSSKKQSLLCKTLLLTILIRLSLFLLSFSRVQVIANKLSKIRTNKKDIKAVEDIIWSVKVSSHYVPNATCLTQAITAQILLTKYNYNSKLKIGVVKSDNFEAHAWVEINNKIILGESQIDFVPILDLEP